MGSLNVNRNVTDLFYRYKMPKLMAKVEGKGNGIKTVIVNMAEIAKALGRPATYPTKYFGCELGAQTQFDNKNDRYIVNGSHEAAKLQDLLDGFIKKYVLCPECENPETELTLKKTVITQRCKACGFNGPLKSVHKLNTYIVKNPPSNGSGQLNGPVDVKKVGKRGKKSNGDTSANCTSNGEARSASPECETTNDQTNSYCEINDTTEEKCNVAEDDDREWAVDVSEEAVRARLLDMSNGARNLTLTDDLEKSEKERIDIFYDTVKKHIESKKIDTINGQKELMSEAERLEVKSKATVVLAELLLGQNIASQALKYKSLFLMFTYDDRKAQKYLIAGIEQVIELHKQQLLSKACGIFKLFYEYDMISEEEFLEYDARMTRKASKGVVNEVHKSAEKFFEWLREAEEETDESDEDDENGDDDDDGIEVVYEESSHKEIHTKSNYITAQATSKGKKTHNDEDDYETENGTKNDLDIDAI